MTCFLLPAGRCSHVLARTALSYAAGNLLLVSVPGGTSSPKRPTLEHENLPVVELWVPEMSLEPKCKPDGCSPRQPMTNAHCRSSLAGRRRSLRIINVLQAFQCVPASWS